MIEISTHDDNQLSGSYWAHLAGRLLGLLLTLRLLGLGDGSLTSSVSDLGLGGTLGEDAGEVSTDDTTLVLGGLAAALLDGLLGETLLVHPPVNDGPRDLARVLALQEQRLGLGVQESEDLGVTTDVELTLGRVDLHAGKVAELDLHLWGGVNEGGISVWFVKGKVGCRAKE